MTRIAARSPLRFALCLLLAVTAVPGSASANRLFMNEMITASNIQRTLVWTMGAELMRAGLDIDEPASMDRVRQAHVRFSQSLAAMQQGNADLEDSDTEEARAIIVAVSQASANWRAFDSALKPALEAGTVTAEQARQLFDLNRQLGDSVERVHVQYQQAAHHYGIVTVIGRAIIVAEHERALSQKITSEFLSVAMGANPSQQVAMVETVALFEQLLRALAYGNPELGLVPSPTPELRQQWSLVESLWGQMAPLVAVATAGGPLSREQVDSFAALSERLQAEVGKAGEMLSALVPPSRE